MCDGFEFEFTQNPHGLNSLSGCWGDDELCYAIKRVQLKWFYFKVGCWMELYRVVIRWVKRNWKRSGDFRENISLSALRHLCCALWSEEETFSSVFIWCSDYRWYWIWTSVIVSSNIQQAMVTVYSCDTERCKQSIQGLIDWLINLAILSVLIDQCYVSLVSLCVDGYSWCNFSLVNVFVCHVFLLIIDIKWDPN